MSVTGNRVPPLVIGGTDIVQSRIVVRRGCRPVFDRGSIVPEWGYGVS